MDYITRLLDLSLKLRGCQDTLRFRTRRRLGKLKKDLTARINSQNPSRRHTKKLNIVKTEDFTLNPQENFIPYSQNGQDAFAEYALKNILSRRTYLEIGAADPVQRSNTFALEKYAEFQGISIEKDQKFQAIWLGTRKNPLLIADALKLDYAALLLLTFGSRHIHYLSVDIDPAPNSLNVLKTLLSQGISFDVLTFEHDKYRFGTLVATASRRLLKSFGYRLILKNAKSTGLGEYEDWWISKNSNLGTIEELSSAAMKFNKLISN